jgi:curli biogenesis system outer membrane secretion channel CsgG
MKRLTVPLLALVIGAGTIAAQAPTKRRIAVLDFDYATVHQWVYDVFGSDQDIGKGIADMLVSNLVRNGTYSVIERKQLDQVMREQNFQQSGRADPSSAVQLAKLLGVDAIVIGSITQFGRDDKKLGVAGGVRVGGIGLGGLGKKSAKAVVVIDARIVSTTTAEILGVATGHGESKRSGLTLGAGAAVGGVAAGGVVDMGSSNFANTIIGEATRSAVDSLTSELVAAASRIQETKVEIRALVADVSGGEVTINVGTGAGVRVGAEYDLVRPGREIKDPATGRVLRRTTTPVGKLKITSADEGSATGTLTGGPARVGDCAGTCPANMGGGGGAAPPSSVEPLNQSNAPAPPTRGTALPTLYTQPVSGAFTWGMYSFKGTEHFRYNVQQRDGNENKTGSYSFDARPAGGGRFTLSVSGSLGSDSYSSTVTLGPNEGVPMMQLIGLGPVGLALFNPVWMLLLGGHQWEIGNGWQQTQNGETTSFKVEERCAQAGVSGVRGVWRQNQKSLMDMCVNPNVPLPLMVTFSADEGSSTALQLVEFRP